MKKFFSLLMTLGFLSAAPVHAEVLPYKANGQEFEGYILRAKEKNAPAILIVHNWMGVSDETKTQAKRFHELGYTVMAADVFGKGVRPKDAKEASALAAKYRDGDRAEFRARLNVALETLKAQPGVDKKKIAAIGYCFGGTGVMELARSGADFAAAVSFHGGLDSPKPADGAKIKPRVLALHGADDPYVSKENLAAFEEELKDHKVKYELVQYPGAVHSFTEKSAGDDNKKGAAYNKEADQKSFVKARGFLKETFQ